MLGKRSCEESSCRARLSRRLGPLVSKPGGPGVGRENRGTTCAVVQISEGKKVGVFVCSCVFGKKTLRAPEGRDESARAGGGEGERSPGREHRHETGRL